MLASYPMTTEASRIDGHAGVHQLPRPQNRSLPITFILLILVFRNAFRSRLRPERSSGYKNLDRLLDLKIQWLMRLAAPDALLIKESAWIASGP